MGFDVVKSYFRDKDLQERVIELEQSSATVALAAKAIGCTPKEIGKTLSFLVNGQALLVVVSGDAKIDNKKYKQTFGEKAKMIPYDQVETYVGHKPGGVCPFVVKSDVEVHLDVSLKRLEKVFPAAGNGKSAVELTIDELEVHSKAISWVDVCKLC